MDIGVKTSPWTIYTNNYNFENVAIFIIFAQLQRSHDKHLELKYRKSFLE